MKQKKTADKQASGLSKLAASKPGNSQGNHDGAEPLMQKRFVKIYNNYCAHWMEVTTATAMAAATIMVMMILSSLPPNSRYFTLMPILIPLGRLSVALPPESQWRRGGRRYGLQQATAYC